MQTHLIRWRGWLVSWAVFALLFGLVSPLVAPAYYALKGSSDFEPALKVLQQGGLVWAMRVGGLSEARLGIGIDSLSLGINAENRSCDQARSAVWQGTLAGAYQATYLAWFRDAHWPVLITLCRSVGSDGEISYGEWQNDGTKPVVHYLVSTTLFAALAVVFFEVTNALSQSKKTRTAT